MRLGLKIAAATAGIFFASSAFAQDIKIALIAGKTGPLEAYAKQTEAGFMMGLEYLTKGTMLTRDLTCAGTPLPNEKKVFTVTWKP